MDTLNDIVNVSGTCYENVGVFSEGLWSVKPGESILQYSLVRFHFELLAMFFLAGSFHFLLKRFNFSRFTSDVLAGIVMGPALMGYYFRSTSDDLFHTGIPNQVLNSFSKIGYIFFVFFAGVQMDTTLIWKTGRKAFSLGMFIFATNFIMASSVDIYFPKGNGLPMGIKGGMIFTGNMYFESMTQTEFVGVCYVLMQLKIINSQLGRLALVS